jgi:hypothetical protein
MNFVDNFDHLKGDYSCDRKSKKWWHRLFFHFIDMCVVNALMIHKEVEMEQFTNKDFRRKVHEGLLAKAIVSTSAVSKTRKSVTIHNHKPRMEGSAHQPRQATSRRCAHYVARVQFLLEQCGCVRLVMCLSA